MKHNSCEESGGVGTFCCKRAGFSGKIVAKVSKIVPPSFTQVVPWSY